MVKRYKLGLLATMLLLLGGEAAVAAPYTVTSAGALGFSSALTELNEAGQGAGSYRLSSTNLNAYPYRFTVDAGGNQTLTGFNGLPAPSGSTFVLDINESGVIVGGSHTNFVSSNVRVRHAFRTIGNSNVVEDLQIFGGGTTDSMARAINNAGQIVGYGGGTGAERAFLFENGVVTDLQTPSRLGATTTRSQANGINDSGAIVGQRWISYGYYGQAFLYENGAVTNIHTALGARDSTAVDVNASGAVVGFATLSIPNTTGTGVHFEERSYIFQGGVATILPTFGGQRSYAVDINDLGQVVGYATTTGGLGSNSWQPYLYSGGVMTNLNALIDPLSGWTITQVSAINNLGRIVAIGYQGANPANTASLILNPTPPPPPPPPPTSTVPEPSTLALVGVAAAATLAGRRQ